MFANILDIFVIKTGNQNSTFTYQVRCNLTSIQIVIFYSAGSLIYWEIIQNSIQNIMWLIYCFVTTFR